MFHSNRPKIKLQKSKIDLGLELLVYLFVALGWIFLLLHYQELPVKIATHFGLSGKPDGYGSKGSIIMLPIVSTVLSVGILLLCKIPHQFNYLVNITEENAEKQYRIACKLMRVLALVLSSGFLLILIHSIYISIGAAGLGPFPGLYILIGIMLPMPWYLYISSKADS